MKFILYLAAGFLGLFSPLTANAQNVSETFQWGETHLAVEITADKAAVIATPKGNRAIIHFTAFRPEEADYEWRCFSASDSKITKGKGTVYERYEKIETSKNHFDSKDIGSCLLVDAGSIQIEWSYGSLSKGWLYYYPGKASIEVVNAKEFESFNLKNK